MENNRKSWDEKVVKNSSSFDGYERLHDEAMDKASVSIHFSDYDDAFSVSKSNSVIFNEVKKIKVSLSQEQLKLNSTGNDKNFLNVPKPSRKTRSTSFIGGFEINNKSEELLNVSQSLSVKSDNLHEITFPHKSVSNNSIQYDEYIYALPNKATTALVAPAAATSTTSHSNELSSITRDIEKLNSFDFHSFEYLSGTFKYPNSFYCKLCNDLLNDPRILDCLHSFCVLCLAKIDATSNLENNQFWRKISDSSNQDQPSISISRSSMESDMISKTKFSLTSNSSKSKKFFKERSPSKNVKGRHSSIISFSEKPKSIICPTCGSTTEMTIHGVYRLTRNVFIERKIRETVGLKHENFNSCQLCAFGVAATSTCLTCDFNLCDSCRDLHKRHALNHEIKSLEKVSAAGASSVFVRADGNSSGGVKSKKRTEKTALKNAEAIKCLIHTRNELKLFCTTCRQIICSECTILIHRGHKMTSTSKASKVYIEMLKEAKDNTKPLTTYAIHSISKLNDISKKINHKCDTVENDVEMFLSQYFEALHVHKRTLLNQIERCRATKMDMIQSQQLDLDRRSSEAKAVIGFTENLLREGTDEENLMLVSLLLRKFDNCRSSEKNLDIKITDTIQFLREVKAPINEAQNNIPLYGCITTQIAVAKNSTLESGDVLMNLRVNKKAELVLQTRDNEGNLMCHGCADIEVTAAYCNVAFKSLPVQINDKRDGTYTIYFMPDSPGLMKISISVNGSPIHESPFSVRAMNLRPHAGIFHCCSFCSSNGKKVCACGSRMEDYNGCGHGHDRHPGRRHWSCCGSLLENSECSVANAISNEKLLV